MSLPRLSRAACALTVAVSLMLVLSVQARQDDRRRLDQVWPERGQLTDLEGTAVSLTALAQGNTASVWVVRIQAAWCGTCQWHAAWTPTLRARYGGRVAVIDLLFADEDNQPADLETGRRWRQRTAGAAVTLLADPRTLEASISTPAPLPRVLVVETRTSAVVASLANPDPGQLIDAIEHALPPGPKAASWDSTRIDGLFTPDQWALVEGMKLPSRPPPDPTNRVADDPAAAALGFEFFFDKSLSPAGVVCGTCHNDGRLFVDGQAHPSYSTGAAKRNLPTVLLIDYARSQFWDGRADSVWGQAVMPFENPDEMRSSRLFVVRAVRDRRRAAYEAVFGPLPALDDGQRFPEQGGPGDAAWEQMREEDRDAISRAFANVGKAIAAFERQLRVAPTALDRYAAGDRQALTADQKDGLVAFFEAGCAQCHYGPRLSNDGFHNLRFPTGHLHGLPDRGRAAGLPILMASEFRKDGRFSDAPVSTRPPVVSDRLDGAFRTPGLRGVSATEPYGHGGTFGDLASVIEAHRIGGLPSDSPFTMGRAEPWAQGFDPTLTTRILRFLKVLGTDLVESP